MAELKTQMNDGSVDTFLNGIEDDQKRADAHVVLELMQQVTGEVPKMWGDSIVGFGKYQYTYASGHTGEWMLTAFAPRKANLTLYLMAGFEQFSDQLARLGRHKIGKGCLYIKRLSDVDLGVLKELIAASVDQLKKSYPPA